MIDRFLNRIAKKVADLVTARMEPRDKFLPPVTMNGMVYLCTESGAIYRMHMDSMNQMEMITQIRRS